MIGYNCDIETQQQLLHRILSENKSLYQVIRNAQKLGLEKYYIGAGCICQTIWNYQNGLDLMYGISDIDIVYYDADLSYDKEDKIIRQVKEMFLHLPVEVDVKNQARVHLWYEKHFGYPCKPYRSVEEAINTWPTTATAIGVRLENEKLVVYAPFGLNDMFGQRIRANKAQITEDTYKTKCDKWCSKWKTLTIMEW